MRKLLVVSVNTHSSSSIFIVHLMVAFKITCLSSVCLLHRASWFKPFSIEEHVVHKDAYEDLEDYLHYEDKDVKDDMYEAYYGGSSSFYIGNR